MSRNVIYTNWWSFMMMNHGVLAFKVLRKSINVSGKLFSWVYFLIKYQFPSKLARRPYFYKLTVILPLGQLPQGQKYHMSCHEKNKICVDLTQVAMQPMATWARLTWGWVQLILMWWVTAILRRIPRFVLDISTMWAPPVIRLFINPMNTIVIGTINQSEIGAICTNWTLS